MSPSPPAVHDSARRVQCACGHPIANHPSGHGPNAVYLAERTDYDVAAANPAHDLSPRLLAAILRARRENPSRRGELMRLGQLRRQSVAAALRRSQALRSRLMYALEWRR